MYQPTYYQRPPVPRFARWLLANGHQESGAVLLGNQKGNQGQLKVPLGITCRRCWIHLTNHLVQARELVHVAFRVADLAIRVFVKSVVLGILSKYPFPSWLPLGTSQTAYYNMGLQSRINLRAQTACK